MLRRLPVCCPSVELVTLQADYPNPIQRDGQEIWLTLLLRACLRADQTVPESMWAQVELLETLPMV
jgi:hypothetical protein